MRKSFTNESSVISWNPARKLFSNALDKLLPKKMIPVLIARTGIAPAKPVNQLSREERMTVVRLMKQFSVRIDAIDDVKNAIVTAGGVCVREVDPKRWNPSSAADFFLQEKFWT